MVDPAAWKNSLALAKSGDADAADRVCTLLLQWTQRKLQAYTRADKEDLCASFVEHMTRDQFTYLTAVERGRLEAYVGMSLRHFIINWRARDDRHRSWEILWADRARGEEDEDADMDDLLGDAPNPEAIVLLREEIVALRAEVTRLTPLNQQIFALLVDEGLTESEASAHLGMNASTVRWHVYAIRRHLSRWRRTRQE